MLGSDVGMILGLLVCKVLGTILGNIDEIKLGLDVGTNLISLD